MPDNIFISETGEHIPIIITTRRGVRNITLRPRIVPKREIHISKPWLTPDYMVLRFIEQKRKWIDKIYANAPLHMEIRPGMRISILGRDVLLVHNPQLRSNEYSRDGTLLIIGGDITMFSRRVRDFVRAELMREIKKLIATTPREYHPRRISLRDTTSRWGSCSTTGTMSFSWRLAFAPYDVMRYVVMHELAHTKHMNHSPAFWATVRELYGFGVERAKRWLNQNGAQLHQYF
ncbi:MAG: M48 family metallopeptidase [Alphaproteobacteria bacterium]|nr:M48 family metallopeptidase [Alphaproteobacteria bacterium]